MRRILPFGDRALLVELTDEDPLALHAAALDDSSLPTDIVDLVPGATTVLVRTEPGAPLGSIGRWFERLEVPERATADATPIVVRVRYDGADLHDVAVELGITVDEVVRRHQAADWRAAFLGFAPGFAYLSAPDAGLQVSRRSDPRTSVPEGAVALAGGYSAIYPRSSPGGWRLIGTAVAVDGGPVVLFDRFPRIRAGEHVRFEADA